MRRNEHERSTRFRGDDRAVSEVVAFILVFGIILSSVAILSMTGFQAMEDYQENEQLQNAERAMDALAENYNDVLQYSGIEERYSELSLREGTVTTGSEGTELDISIDGDPIRNDTDSKFHEPAEDTFTLGEFRYETGSDAIAYDGGAVVREADSGSAVVRQPQLKCNTESERAVISLVTIDADDRSIQSSEGLGFTMTVENRTSELYDGGEFDVVVDADSPAQTAWDDAILDRGDWDEGECSDVDEVLVTTVEVDIGY